MANPAWRAGMVSPNPTGNTRHRDRFKAVAKRSSLEKKIAAYLTKRWGQMVEDMSKLNERDRTKAFIELLAYAMPKKAAISSDSLTPEQVETLYQRVTELANAKAN